MKKAEITFKDLSKVQLDTLKEIYIESRLEKMSEVDLRSFTREVLALQVGGTVGNEEEKEIWKEMQEHFEDEFPEKIKEVKKIKGGQDVNFDDDIEQEDFKKRLEILEQRSKEESKKNNDMWNDD